MLPKITIIITSYNQRAYLREAIESVLCQTQLPYEILIADDCSTDGSRALIREYEKSYPGLIKGVYQNQNLGIPKNRNAALRQVTGDFVGILDGDDLFLPNKIYLQAKAIQRSPDIGAVYANFNIVDSNRNLLGVKWRGPQPTGNIFAEVAKIKTGLLRTLIVDYKLIKLSGFLDERLSYYDGLWLTIKLAGLCKVIYIDEVLLEKRDHNTSDSKTLTALDHYGDLNTIYIDLLEIVDRYVNEEEKQRIITIWKNRFIELKK